MVFSIWCLRNNKKSLTNANNIGINDIYNTIKNLYTPEQDNLYLQLFGLLIYLHRSKDDEKIKDIAKRQGLRVSAMQANFEHL